MKSQAKTNRSVPRMAAAVLRMDHGSISRIARSLGVNRSTVSRVVGGTKTSQRVRDEVVAECRRIVETRSPTHLPGNIPEAD